MKESIDMIAKCLCLKIEAQGGHGSPQWYWCWRSKNSHHGIFTSHMLRYSGAHVLCMLLVLMRMHFHDKEQGQWCVATIFYATASATTQCPYLALLLNAF
jgi:hypothetical protein